MKLASTIPRSISNKKTCRRSTHSANTMHHRCSSQLLWLVVVAAAALALGAADAEKADCRATGITVTPAGGQPAAPVSPEAFDEVGAHARASAAALRFCAGGRCTYQ